MLCPCGSTDEYDKCCGRFIAGERTATTAEELMRSRYTAYTCKASDYLLATWHPSTRPQALLLDAEPTSHWLGLKIVSCIEGLADNSSGTVEFIARYKINGRAQRLHEVSRFLLEGGRWYYLGAV